MSSPLKQRPTRLHVHKEQPFPILYITYIKEKSVLILIYDKCNNKGKQNLLCDLISINFYNFISLKFREHEIYGRQYVKTP